MHNKWLVGYIAAPKINLATGERTQTAAARLLLTHKDENVAIGADHRRFCPPPSTFAAQANVLS